MKRVLIIDDDEAILRMMDKLISKAGYEVHTAANGDKASHILNDDSMFDLVITDIIMPKKEGIEIVTMLKNKYPQIKIIAISGGGRFSPEGYLKAAGIFGAHKTFVKPFDHREMLNAIRELIGNADRQEPALHV